MQAAVARMEAQQPLSLRPVVNATGVVLHTNLGRALLAEAAVEAVAQAAGSAVNLEYDLDTRRARRSRRACRGRLAARSPAPKRRRW